MSPVVQRALPNFVPKLRWYPKRERGFCYFFNEYIFTLETIGFLAVVDHVQELFEPVTADFQILIIPKHSLTLMELTCVTSFFSAHTSVL